MHTSSCCSMPAGTACIWQSPALDSGRPGAVCSLIVSDVQMCDSQAAGHAAKPVRQGECRLTLAMSSSLSLRSSGNLNTQGATVVVFAAL